MQKFIVSCLATAAAGIRVQNGPSAASVAPKRSSVQVNEVFNVATKKYEYELKAEVDGERVAARATWDTIKKLSGDELKSGLGPTDRLLRIMGSDVNLQTVVSDYLSNLDPVEVAEIICNIQNDQQRKSESGDPNFRD